MRRLIAVLVFLAYAVPVTAAAQGQLVNQLTLERGQGAVLRLDEGGGVLLMRQGAAGELSEFAADVGRANSEGAYDYAVGDVIAEIPMDRHPPAPSLEPQVLRVSFVQVPGTQDSLLVIENGYDRAVRYRARMTRPGHGAEPTDVCLIMPHRHVFEHWPYAIEALEIYELRTEHWRDGDPVPCE